MVKWKDELCSWIPLKDIKASNPIEVAEYAIHKGIEDEPAFSWWVKHTLKKRNRVISKVKSRYWKILGIRTPKSVEEALQIDKETSHHYNVGKLQPCQK